MKIVTKHENYSAEVIANSEDERVLRAQLTQNLKDTADQSYAERVINWYDREINHFPQSTELNIKNGDGIDEWIIEA